MGPRRRGRLLALLLVVAVTTGGCRIEAEVAIDVDPDGSGAVRVAVALDEEVGRRVDDLSDQLVVDDLEAAGWLVEGPSSLDDGSTVVSAEKRFATAEQLGEVLSELSGAEGPFGDFRLDRRGGPVLTTYTIEGEVDLRSGVEGFGDEDLRQRLEGSGFGLDQASLERATGIPLDQLFDISVRIHLPGSLTSGGTAHTTDGEVATWRPAMGEHTTLAATSRLLHVWPLAWFSAAALAAVALLAVLAVRAVRRRRADRPPGAGGSSPA